MHSFLMPLLHVFIHTVVIYSFLIAMLHFVSRRQLGQLTVIDLVIIILLGSAVETAMVNGDTSLQAGIVCSSTLLLLNYLLGRYLFRSRRLRHLVTGGPVLLIHDGQFIDEHLRRAGLTRSDVLEALREREQADVSQIKFAVLEMDGAINVVPMQATTHRSKRHLPGGPIVPNKG